MYMLEIRANAFLWHQIRCIMAVLLLIGEGKEQAEVISELLDVAKNPWLVFIIFQIKILQYFSKLCRQQAAIHSSYRFAIKSLSL